MKYTLAVVVFALSLLLSGCISVMSAETRFGGENLGDDTCVDLKPCFQLVGTTNPTPSVIENWQRIKTESKAPASKVTKEKAK